MKTSTVLQGYTFLKVLLSHRHLLTDHTTLFSKCEASSLSESPEEEEVDTPEEQKRDEWSSEAGSEDTPLSPSSAFSPTTNPWPDSPRKRTQTLPSLSCPAAGKTSREPGWERWSRFQESFNENEEKTFSEDIFKLLDLQKVTFSPTQKSEQEKVEGQTDIEDTNLYKTGCNVVAKQIDAPKTQAQSIEPLPKPQPRNDVSMAALSREKPAAPATPAALALQKGNETQPGNTDSTNIINRYGTIHSHVNYLLIYQYLAVFAKGQGFEQTS